MERKPNTGPGAENRPPNKPPMEGTPRQDGKQTAHQGQSQAQKVGQEASDRARSVAGQARDAAHEIGSEVDSGTQRTRDQIREQARDVGSAAERMATSQMERGRHQVAESVHTVGEALRLGAQQVRQKEGSSNVQFLERLAEPMDRVSGYLERHDTREIAHDLETFARRNEALFLGGAFALGVLGARFLSASSADSRRAGGDWSTGPRETALVPREDTITRPGAPGYQPPFERSTMGDRPGAAGPRIG